MSLLGSPALVQNLLPRTL
ncbi:uncharacterized protein ARMOST_19923 [Armillaria ostoyae]|uniref:Uncharacterized protein n=1 Tax=Armillaria ostoyae TaxID=47428 RepID=A0A284S5X8_ARMOS|nr:uncharacterized protein ARMOST_19923 [Armillaria ostoyae]